MSPAAGSDAHDGRGAHEPDPDAWAAAAEEDLAAERERRRAGHGGYDQPSAAEELRRLADAVSARLTELGAPFAARVAGSAAQDVARQLLTRARAAVEPVVERNPQVFDHLAAAGGELIAAYRAAVRDAEHRWTAEPAGREAERHRPDGPAEPGGPGSGGPAGSERIGLDTTPEAPTSDGRGPAAGAPGGGTPDAGDRDGGPDSGPYRGQDEPPHGPDEPPGGRHGDANGR